MQSYHLYSTERGNFSETMVSGSVSLHMAYNAWGKCNYVDPSTEEGPPYVEHSYNARWGYLGDETGLYYCQNRYYDPGTGRFLTRDPISYSGGMNLYGYCGGGPVGAADPSGLILVNLEPLDKCAKLRLDMKKLIDELYDRLRDLNEDKYNLYPFTPFENPMFPFAGSWKGHVDQYNGKQRRLWKLLQQYFEDDDCRKGPPPCDKDGYQVLALPAPEAPFSHYKDADYGSWAKSPLERLASGEPFAPIPIFSPKFPFPIPILVP